MIKDLYIPLYDMVMCLSDAMDLISTEVVDHHKQVAYISYCIALQLGLPAEEQKNILLAGALHDSGAFSQQERIDALKFELDNPHKHAETSYLMLKNFKPFTKIAELVRYHHVPWEYGRGAVVGNRDVPLGSHILHLADRVSVLIKKEWDILGQVPQICEKIKNHSGKKFKPELVEAFLDVAAKEFFWLDVVSPKISSILSQIAKHPSIKLDAEGILSLADLFRQIIDFRSPFTTNHSSGVAASAEVLAQHMGFSETECTMMRIAGYLHDLGKLAVPVEILHKPGKLTTGERNIIKSHTYYTFRILQNIDGLQIINAWASFHHERLDGKGYPFRLHKGNLPLGSKIMAVADVFTALTEDRPYREGLPKEKVFAILENMALEGALDTDVVGMLRAHYPEINHYREDAQQKSAHQYTEFMGGKTGTAGNQL